MAISKSHLLEFNQQQNNLNQYIEPKREYDSAIIDGEIVRYKDNFWFEFDNDDINKATSVTLLGIVDDKEVVHIPDKFIIKFGNEVKDFPVNLTEGMLENNKALKHLSISPGITRIPDGLCNNCKNLETVSLPNTVTFIGAQAFENTSIGINNDFKLPCNIKFIDEAAFYGTKLNGSLCVPSSCHSIGKYSFDNCNLKEVVIQPDTCYDKSAFDKNVKVEKMEKTLSLNEKIQNFLSPAKDLTFKMGDLAQSFEKNVIDKLDKFICNSTAAISKLFDNIKNTIQNTKAYDAYRTNKDKVSAQWDEFKKDMQGRFAYDMNVITSKIAQITQPKENTKANIDNIR